MNASIKLLLSVILMTSVLALAQEAPAGPETPKLPPAPPGQEIVADEPPPAETNEMLPPNQGPHGQGKGQRERMGMPGQRMREHFQQKENELLNWFEQNDPNKAKDLKALKEKDQRAYTRRMMMEMRNYWGIIEAQHSNPALAEVLKKDMVLKEKRTQLLEQIKASKDETKKAELIEQLKDVLGERFDLIVQKKQLRYEDLKKRLEQLQEDLKKSQADLDTIKDKKEQQVQKHLDELLNHPEEIDWN
ncbi:MAG: hypothetical protein A2Y12_07070 [Planctomycetes bacterium GWF2_42_9]|nr:MAG: hypothetical protein A2Y12_07070 [Planctomycetes bacterium GWF2_42_9]HAL44942.1 hypothetical protein [Phycisphaerales bacterium]